MRASLTYSYDDFSRDANQLFEHWRSLRSQETCVSHVIQRFRALFIDGINYPETPILQALHRIVTSPWAEATTNPGLSFYTLNGPLNFNGIINRCCYILINYWWLQSMQLQATAKLVNLIGFDSFAPATSEATQRLRELMRKFRQTEAYQALQDRAQIAAEQTSADPASDTQQPLRRLVYRYPYLYPHLLSHCDVSESGFDAVQSQQKRKQLLYEEKLNAYLIHLIQNKEHPDRASEKSRILNPCNLTDEQLRQSVKQFIGPAEKALTYKQVAQQRVQQISRATSCQEMKQQVHTYITSTFQFSDHPQAQTYHQSSHFNNWLEERLQEVLRDERYEKPTGHRLIRTCGEILNCLIASPRDPIYGRFHPVFLSLHGNLGATFTTSLLLKITLLFQNVKDYAEQFHRLLAKRFAEVLNHYGSAMSNDEHVQWLVECLENWQIALSLHFGQTDFSGFSKWVKHL